MDRRYNEGHPNARQKELRMARLQHTHSLPHLEEALTALFCFIDDANALLNPHHDTTSP